MELIFRTIKYGSTPWKEAVSLREDILRKPLGSLFSPEELESERDHIQIGGFHNGTLIATSVLVPEPPKIKMQRVVVTENLRNREIGTRMLAFCEELGKGSNFEILYCHARDSAVNFYLKNGYSILGDFFEEDGIPHLKMEKRLKS